MQKFAIFHHADKSYVESIHIMPIPISILELYWLAAEVGVLHSPLSEIRYNQDRNDPAQPQLIMTYS